MPRKCSNWPELVSRVTAALIVLGCVCAHAQTLAPLAVDEPILVFLDTESAEASEADAELCGWALDDWVRHAQVRIETRSAAEADATIRVYFVSPGSGRYGEMRPIIVDDRRGAEVYVRTETDTLGPEIAAAARADSLYRDTVVYLTCLHEIGHALGMMHTDRYADVMYFFGFGGDIHAFFDRYRRRLERRGDIASVSGLSEGDVAQLTAAYPVE